MPTMKAHVLDDAKTDEEATQGETTDQLDPLDVTMDADATTAAEAMIMASEDTMTGVAIFMDETTDAVNETEYMTDSMDTDAMLYVMDLKGVEYVPDEPLNPGDSPPSLPLEPEEDLLLTWTTSQRL